MAQQGVLLDHNQFSCSICLDLLKDPVATPCGHSYCMSCIKDYWDQDDQKGVYSCPQCRQTFTPRPVLRKNNMLAEVVEKLKKTELQAAPPADSSAGPGDVLCDVCSGRKQKALKSCLVCLVSYCEAHLQPHYESPAFKKHKLVKASSQLLENICSRHDELMKEFCRTDQQCICLVCVMDEHQGHDTVSTATERTEKQRELGLSQQNVQKRVQQREKELKELQQAVESLTRSAQAAEVDSERIFTELILSIERRRSEVKELIRAQQRAAVSQAEGLVERLEQEIAQLKKRYAELEQLSHTEDHINFLQGYQSLSTTNVSSDLPSTIGPHRKYFCDVREAVSKLKEKLEDILKDEWPKITTTVNPVDLLLPPEPKTRADVLQYSCQLTLDPNTAVKCISLSEGNRTVKYTFQVQLYLYHAERFTDAWQVLCRNALSGRCYWEVEWSGRVGIAVSYKDISRTGRLSRFGYNDKSWCLENSGKCFCFRHDNVEAVTSSFGSRVGVYLDHMAGTLSFYSISDTMTLIHRVQTTFTQPLYPGFVLQTFFSTAKLCDLE
ncbi:E3 ubiquitin/ISG15 ligase TRIM25-like isoform X1 [Hypomesus transpacificus]|uniref:E3 ubiquitin/ISG15 ligase TRIM25-like isoform X1 n=1 Tax=Hypomesus transpacificus TaxID=137520 RepID=UPI001F084796|nr:E3 ubiquitin/ISG15 ligase TRIM25-like isoform X1 [Hypomesus transpacificus]